MRKQLRYSNSYSGSKDSQIFIWLICRVFIVWMLLQAVLLHLKGSQGTDKHQTLHIAHLLHLNTAHELPPGFLLIDADGTQLPSRLSERQSFHRFLAQSVTVDLQGIRIRTA